MKKTDIIKIVYSGLVLLFGVIIIVIGATGNAMDYNYNYCGYGEYGGDAYTDIQNTAADVSYNVAAIGINLSSAINKLYIFSGILLVIVGAHLVLRVCFNIKPEKQLDDTSYELINKYKSLLETSAITQEEFEKKKKKLLDL